MVRFAIISWFVFSTMKFLFALILLLGPVLPAIATPKYLECKATSSTKNGAPWGKNSTHKIFIDIDNSSAKLQGDDAKLIVSPNTLRISRLRERKTSVYETFDSTVININRVDLSFEAKWLYSTRDRVSNKVEIAGNGVCEIVTPPADRKI